MIRDQTQLRMDGIAFSTPAGSRVVIPPGSAVHTHDRVVQLFDGVGFGPLAVMPKVGGTAGLTRIEYEVTDQPSPRDDKSSDLMAGGALAATTTAGFETEQRPNDGGRQLADAPDVTRRELLGIGATVLGAGWLAADHTLAPAGTIVAEAEIDLSTNTHGVQIGFLSTGPAQSTAAPSYEAEFAGSDVGDVDGRSDVLDVPAESTGTVSIRAKAQTT